MRPCVSVAGTRCTRWPPDSKRSAAVDVVALDAQHQLLVAAEVATRSRDITSVRQPLALGIAQVHARQVAGEQRRLVAAGAGADLEEGVALVVRVARQQRRLQLGVQPLEVGLRRRRSPRRAMLGHLGVGQHLAARRRGRARAAGSGGSAATSCATSACSRDRLAVALHVAGDLRVGQRGVELGQAQARGVRTAGAGMSFMAGRQARGRDGGSAARGAARRRGARAPLTLVVAGAARGLRAGTGATRSAPAARAASPSVGMQLGQRAVQHLLRQAARQRLEHRVDVLAARQQLARARDLGAAPVVGLAVAAPGSAAPRRAGRASARSSARRRR